MEAEFEASRRVHSFRLILAYLEIQIFKKAPLGFWKIEFGGVLLR